MLLNLTDMDTIPLRDNYLLCILLSIGRTNVSPLQVFLLDIYPIIVIRIDRGFPPYNRLLIISPILHIHRTIYFVLILMLIYIFNLYHVYYIRNVFFLYLIFLLSFLLLFLLFIISL